MYSSKSKIIILIIRYMRHTDAYKMISKIFLRDDYAGKMREKSARSDCSVLLRNPASARDVYKVSRGAFT